MKVLLGKSVGSGLGLYTGTSVPVFLTFVCDKYILVTMKQCTIVIRDEVNIKLEGLDLDMRRRLVNQFKYDVP